MAGHCEDRSKVTRRVSRKALLARFAILGIILFWLAMLFPALASCPQLIPGSIDWLDNGDVLLEGPLGPLFFEFGWYGNVPFVFVAIGLLRGHRVGRWLVIAQIVLVLSSLLPVTLLGPSETPTVICRWGLGYWLWFAAQVLVAGAGIASRNAAGRQDAAHVC